MRVKCGPENGREWMPTRNSGICSAHFRPEDFQRRFHWLEGMSKPISPRLVRDEIGIKAIPSIHFPGKDVSCPQTTPVSDRERRKVRNFFT